MSCCLNDLPDPAQTYGLHNPIIFRPLDCFHSSWHSMIPTVWRDLVASLLLQGHAAGWHSVLKSLQTVAITNYCDCIIVLILSYCAVTHVAVLM